MKNKIKVFVLEHIYLVEKDEEIKHIGIFSSIENAQNATNILKNVKGFCDHPVDCFVISESILDNYEWKEGFVTLE